MQSTEQKLREALQAYQDANEMSPYGDYSKIEWESSAGPVNPSWGGGDCKKHGRWYGRCYSCSDEWNNLRKSADRDAHTARENALNAAKQMARQALTLPTDDVKSVLQGALNVLGCLEYGLTGVDSWPCEDSVEDVVHRIRKVLEESQ